jgi:negative regulator of replication initiation
MQPLNFNHEGETLYDIVRTTEKEMSNIDEDNITKELRQKMTAISLLVWMDELSDANKAVVGMLFRIIYKENFEKVSHIIERIINVDMSEEDNSILIACITAALEE